MLRILNLEAGYGPLRVLKGISLHVSPGEIVAIIGANGAGKTTLLKTSRRHPAARCGEDRVRQTADSRHGRRKRSWPWAVRLVPEGRHVFSTLTVRENLILGAYSCRRHGTRLQPSTAGLEQVYDLFRHPARSDRASWPARSPAASSRCWPSAGR